MLTTETAYMYLEELLCYTFPAFKQQINVVHIYTPRGATLSEETRERTSFLPNSDTHLQSHHNITCWFCWLCTTFTVSFPYMPDMLYRHSGGQGDKYRFQTSNFLLYQIIYIYLPLVPQGTKILQTDTFIRLVAERTWPPKTK